MLVGMYYILREGVTYKKLGPAHLDEAQPLRLTHYLVKRLESLGHEVTLTPLDQAAWEYPEQSDPIEWEPEG